LDNKTSKTVDLESSNSEKTIATAIVSNATYCPRHNCILTPYVIELDKRFFIITLESCLSYLWDLMRCISESQGIG